MNFNWIKSERGYTINEQGIYMQITIPILSRDKCNFRSSVFTTFPHANKTFTSSSMVVFNNNPESVIVKAKRIIEKYIDDLLTNKSCHDAKNRKGVGNEY